MRALTFVVSALSLTLVARPAHTQVEAKVSEGATWDRAWRSGLGQDLFVFNGTSYHGSALLQTDGLSPTAWRTSFNQLAATLGGPVPGVPTLGFFLTGQLEGQKYRELNDGFNDVPIYLRSGTAELADGSPAVFTLRRQSSAPGAWDSLTVAFPDYVTWDNGPTLPFNPRDAYYFAGNLVLGLGGGSRLDLAYRRTRRQAIELGLDEIYNPDGFAGRSSTADGLTFGGYFELARTAASAMSLDLKIGHRGTLDRYGILDPSWRVDHIDPFLGFNFNGLGFFLDAEDWAVSEALYDAVRSNAIPADSLLVFPGRSDLRPSSTLPGLSDVLRLNPFAVRYGFPIRGFANEALDYTRESTWLMSGRLDWQPALWARLKVDADLALIRSERHRVPLQSSRASVHLSHPVASELYSTGRFDLGPVVIDAGLRWERFDPDMEYPRVPGYVFNVPDSLKADFVELEPYDPENPRSFQVRVVPLEDCGGAATEEDRRRPDGTLVCQPNFVAASAKSALSPELSLTLPFSPRSTLRLSYSQRVALPLPGLGIDPVRAADLELYRNVNDDFAGGAVSTRALFGRDVDLPRVVEVAAEYRHVLGSHLFVDVGGFWLSLRDRLALGLQPFENPNFQGQSVFINALSNGDDAENWGVDLRLALRLGDAVELSGGYSFLDSWIGQFESRRFEQAALADHNLSLAFDRPMRPAVGPLVDIDQGDQHYLAGDLSLRFPSDFEPGSPLASVLADFTFYAGARFASGAVYTRLENRGTGTIGPPTVFENNSPAEQLNSSRLPWQKHLDLRLSKGFRVWNQKLRVYADWLNPFGFTNTERVYLETGTPENTEFTNRLLSGQMSDPYLDDDTEIDDFDIRAESPENALNVFALLEAERRFGDGDGVFTIAEQRRAFGAWYDLFFGRQWLESSNQRLLLGLEIVF